MVQALTNCLGAKKDEVIVDLVVRHTNFLQIAEQRGLKLSANNALHNSTRAVRVSARRRGKTSNACGRITWTTPSPKRKRLKNKHGISFETKKKNRSKEGERKDTRDTLYYPVCTYQQWTKQHSQKVRSHWRTRNQRLSACCSGTKAKPPETHGSCLQPRWKAGR